MNPSSHLGWLRADADKPYIVNLASPQFGIEADVGGIDHRTRKRFVDNIIPLAKLS